jgi:superfamily II DNA or RNA helicase
MGGFENLAAQFDPVDTKRKGDEFELVCKWFLENDPTYQHLLRRVWLWKDWPGRKGIDAGIDLVAEDHDGKLWAIQAKAYAPAYSISKANIDKFVAESSRKVFTHRLLIGTTDKRHHIAATLMDDLGIPFLGLTQLREADDYLDWPASLAALRPAKQLKPKKPWDYQKAAITNVVKGFQSVERGQLIMACGTGKTLTAWFIREDLDAERTLVLVPSLALLKQTMREWQTAHPAKPFATLPVCSDETVGSLGDDAAVSHTSDLGVPVTTDPVQIAEFLRKRSGPRVVFSTYQSSPQIAAAFALGQVPSFDLVIADEAHRAVGPVSSDFATVLDPAAIKARRRLFMTATPRYFTGRIIKEARDSEYEIASMDDEAKFGPVFHRLSFSEAIERNLLTDYRVAIIGVDDATYLDWAERGTLVNLDGKKTTDARSLAGQIGLAKAMRSFDLRRVISFHSRVKASKDFAASMPAVLDWMPPESRPEGRLWSDYASGEMSAGERHVLIQHLKRLDDGERGLLANARCLAEGVDVPALDGIAFIDPKRSEVDIVQAVGRAIRLADDKTVGTIVIPVFIADSQDPEVALDDSAFKPVWEVIKALRAHDEELGEQLDTLRRQLGRQGEPQSVPGKIHFDLPDRVGAEFARAFDVRLVEQTTATWEFWFGLLERYVEHRGDARVLASYTIDGNALGRWASKQRSRYARGTLEPDRQNRLRELPGWTWDSHTDQWEEGLRRLRDYVDCHGDTLVPARHTVGGHNLGSWVSAQRTSYAKGTLEADRQQRLQDVPGWVWNAVEIKWVEGFQRLLNYVDRHGDALVPNSYTVDGHNLGSWLARQRTDYAKGTLEPDRQQRLQNVPGWTWDPYAARWEEGFQRLLDYVELNGDARVPKSYAVDGHNLGSWVAKQRRTYSAGTLQADRQQRLQDVPGWAWDSVGDRWEDGFRRLRDYVERHGDARVPQSYTVDGHNLGKWVAKQRRTYSAGILEADRQQRLQDVPGWVWDPFAAQWEEGLRRLRDYVDRHGDALVPDSYRVDGYNLGSWVGVQRRVYSSGTLEVDRQERLQELPGWTWDPYAARWEEGFQRLLDYVELNGDARVPKGYTVDGYKLGLWVERQRGIYSAGTLQADRQQRLQELHCWTWGSRATKWEEGFERLLEYVERQNNSLVPALYEVNGYPLGRWVAKQRTRYAKGTLETDRQQRLQDLPGWVWDAVGIKWEEGLSRLREYVERHGDALVPTSYKVNGYPLGKWVSHQRFFYSRGTLEADRAKRLEGFPGWAWRAR